MVRQRRWSLWSNTKLFLPALLVLLVPAAACGGLFAEAAAEPSELRGTVPVEDACPEDEAAGCEPTPQPSVTPEDPPSGYKGSVGEFEIVGSGAGGTILPCADNERQASQEELRASELWFEEVHGIETDEPHHAVCQGVVTYISGDAEVTANKPWSFYGGDFYYSAEHGARLPWDVPRDRLLETEIGGRPTLMQLNTGDFNDCRIAVIERRPTEDNLGIVWGIDFPRSPEKPLECEGAKDFVDELLNHWAEPWIEGQQAAPGSSVVPADYALFGPIMEDGWGCSEDLEWMGTDGQGAMRASELWFTIPDWQIDAHRTTWAGYSCEGAPWLIVANGSLPGAAAAFASLSNERFDVNMPVVATALSDNYVKTEIGGRPALVWENVEESLPYCEIFVIERRPTDQLSGLGWRAFVEMTCDQSVGPLAAFLEKWAEPWIEPASSPRDALAAYMDLRDEGPEYVGLCERFSGPYTADRICAFDHGQSGDQKVFGISPTDNAGWATELYFVRPERDGWLVDHAEPGPCRNSIPCPVPPGATVEIVVDDEGSCANIRAEPAIDAPINTCLPGGTQGLIEGEGVWVDGRIWVQLVERGWISASYMRCTGNCQYPDNYFSCGV